MDIKKTLTGLIIGLMPIVGCSAPVTVNINPKPIVVKSHPVETPEKAEAPWLATFHEKCSPGKIHTKRTHGQNGSEIGKFFEPKSIDTFDFCKKFHIGIYTGIQTNNQKAKVLYTLHTSSRELYAVVSIKTGPRTFSAVNCNLSDSTYCEKFMNIYTTNLHRTLNDPFGYGIKNSQKIGLGLILYDWTKKKPCDIEIVKIPRGYRKMISEKCDQQYEEELIAVELSEQGLDLLKIIEQEQGLDYLP
ncbi:hypothetical protein HOD05_02725 [Candidatus Woesearchaeota archaeon]|jgi:hypothetical protein|nr:hypothetical protein [Candidatus Woesearchaeota archaeon]MBT4151286.1 hypothetical protein [Candidatus Woesearchaeota archaeon]MBT4247477.1 hypothetical protein [Candidatus Woesearchaeota archaeon]MBT4434108.1 hypothetical protein [Candidatus Woesearchaeota archaeon]MBT7332231.1 hypothetical protein [Candidatus Woesearchaeota archaeon]